MLPQWTTRSAEQPTAESTVDPGVAELTSHAVGNQRPTQGKSAHFHKANSHSDTAVFDSTFSSQVREAVDGRRGPVSAQRIRRCVAEVHENFMRSNWELLQRLGELDDRVLLCHCKPEKNAHADVLWKRRPGPQRSTVPRNIRKLARTSSEETEGHALQGARWNRDVRSRDLPRANSMTALASSHPGHKRSGPNPMARCYDRSNSSVASPKSLATCRPSRALLEGGLRASVRDTGCSNQDRKARQQTTTTPRTWKIAYKPNLNSVQKAHSMEAAESVCESMGALTCLLFGTRTPSRMMDQDLPRPHEKSPETNNQPVSWLGFMDV